MASRFECPPALRTSNPPDRNIGPRSYFLVIGQVYWCTSNLYVNIIWRASHKLFIFTATTNAGYMESIKLQTATSCCDHPQRPKTSLLSSKVGFDQKVRFVSYFLLAQQVYFKSIDEFNLKRSPQTAYIYWYYGCWWYGIDQASDHNELFWLPPSALKPTSPAQKIPK